MKKVSNIKFIGPKILLKLIFSTANSSDKNHKIITIFGVKLKFKKKLNFNKRYKKTREYGMQTENAQIIEETEPVETETPETRQETEIAEQGKAVAIKREEFEKWANNSFGYTWSELE